MFVCVCVNKTAEGCGYRSFVRASIVEKSDAFLTHTAQYQEYVR